jgi:hypothetical protein
MSHPAVTRSVCTALLRELSGFRGYPKDGESRYIDVLQEISLSVEHARAIVHSFDGEFPTIREMRDVGMNLRLKFQPELNQRAEWEAEYGKPQPFQVDAIQPGELPDAALWRQILHRVGDPAKVQRASWAKLAELADEFGFPEYAAAWRRSAGA